MASQIAIVSKVVGNAYIRDSDGNLQQLQSGMEVPLGANIITTNGASVELQPQHGQAPIEIGQSREVILSAEVAQNDVDPAINAAAPLDAEAEAILTALDAGDDPFADLDPTAAVIQAGGDGAGGSSFTRLASIIELTNPLAIEYPRPELPRPEEVRLGGVRGNAAPELTIGLSELQALLDQLNDDSDVITGINVGQYFTDADGDDLTFSATGLPPGLTIDPNTGIISGTIDKSASQGGPNDNGIYNVTITANDGRGGTVDLPFTWTTLNPPPVATDDAATTEENTIVEGNVIEGYYTDNDGNRQEAGPDHDPDGDDISVVGVSSITNPDNVNNWTPVTGAGVEITGTNSADGKGGGTFTLYPDGSYTFNPGTDFDYLKEGETTTTTISYQISDGEGGFDTAILEITVTGTNDAPIIAPVGDGTDDSATITEIEDGHDDENVITHERDGVITFSDPDNNDSHTITFAANDENETDLGDFTATINPNNPNEVIWDFKVEDKKIDHLMEGETLVQEYVVTITDEFGDSAKQTVTITIVGTNDAPIITDDSVIVGTVTEDDPVDTVNGQMVWTDADTKDTHTWDLEDANGAYGELTINDDGSWEYKLDNSNPDVQALGEGEELTEEIWVVVTDTAGATAKEKITITINGTNDVPVIEPSNNDYSDKGEVIEAGVDQNDIDTAGIPTVDGQLFAKDVDTGETETLKWGLTTNPANIDPDNLVNEIDGVYGKITLDTDGNWVYTLDNEREVTQKLQHGDVETEVFTAVVQDVHGAWVEQEITITVNGTNDRPELTLDENSVKEAGVGGADGKGNTENKGVLTAEGNVLTNDADIDSDILNVTDVNLDGYTTQNDNGVLTIVGKYGTLVMQPDGSYVYTLDNDKADHLALGDEYKENFVYKVSDNDGATSETKLTITVNGTNDKPYITSDAGAAMGEVVEEGVDADGNPVAGTSEVSGKLTADDADNNHTLTWTLQDGNISVSSMNGTYGSITLDANGNWVYTLDNTLPATNALGDNDVETETFTARVQDEHGAWVEQVITVTVQGTNDAPVANADVHKFNEDPKDGFVKGNVLYNDENPEGDLTVTKIKIDGDEVNVPEDGSDLVVHLTATGTTTDENESIGTLTIDKDGDYTFTPKEHYSGDVPVIEYTVQEGGGDVGENSLTDTSTLTFEITPVADAPDMAAPEKLWVKEDEAVKLGLTAPEVVDNVDLNGLGDNGDNPELLGVITISGIPAGSIIHGLPGGNINSDGGSIKVVISDHHTHGHINGAADEDGVITLTKDEFESLSVTPPAHDADNFNVTVKATSYEVDNDGNPLPGIPGAESSTTTTVNVLAVTDPVELTFSNGNKTATREAQEDIKFNITKELKASFEDLDGSEQRDITITGLPEGAEVYVDGVKTIIGADGTIKIDATGQTGDINSFPKIEVKAPSQFSGEMHGIKVTLNAKDTDADNPNHENHIETKSDSVTLNLNVNPVVDGINVVGVSGKEDTLIENAFKNITFASDKDGSEIITQLVIEMPDGFDDSGWKLFKDEKEVTLTDGKLVIDLDGGISSNQSAKLRAAVDGYDLMPPNHSSEDITFTVKATVTDTAEIDGEHVTVEKDITKDLLVKVTPVAEKVGVDFDGDGVDDLIMTKGHVYNDKITSKEDFDNAVTGNEDEGFFLKVDGFDLKDGWSNQDGKLADGTDNPDSKDGGTEETYALLNPYLVGGNSADNPGLTTDAYFTYNDNNGEVVTVYYTNTNPNDSKDTGFKGGFLIPMEFLDTVVFYPPKDLAGEFKIEVNAYTVDKDFDSNLVDTAVSGEEWLEGIIILPVADGIESIGVKSVNGLEDQPIELSIKPTSLDPSEVFNIKISDIPEGSKITYKGVELTVENGSVIIDNYDDANSLTITPPHNSNENIELKVQGQTVDKVVIDGVEYADTSPWMPEDKDVSLHVNVKGVADEAEVTIKGDTDNPVEFTEAELDGHEGVEPSAITLEQLVGDIKLHDDDGSETLSIKISDLPEGFNLTGDNVIFMGGDGATREWVISIPEGKTLADVLEGVTITTPNNFSGKLPGSITAITTENDGDSKVGDKHEFNAIVTPSPESTLNANTTIDEDSLGQVNFGIANNNGDENESLTAVYIKVNDVEGKEFTLYLGKDGLTLAEAAADSNSGITIENGYYKLTGEDINNIFAKADANFAHNEGGAFEFDVKYEVTDESNDGSVPAVTETVDSLHSITVTPITDPVELKEFDVVNVNSHDGFSVDFTVAKKPDANADDKADTDGSEQFTQVVITGVPEGMILDGITLGSGDDATTLDSSNVVFLGDGKWMINIPTSDAAKFEDDITGSLQFKSGDFLTNGQHELGVAVVTQDTGADNIETDNKGLTIDAQISGSGDGTADLDSVTTDVEIKNFTGTEDASFKLSDVIDVTINNKGDADESLETNYSVIVKLPEGAQIFDGDTEITSTLVGDEEVWIISGKGTQSDLDDLLKDLNVIPPKDWNDNNGEMPLDVTVTTHLDNGSQNTNKELSGDNSLDVSLTPVTDGAVVDIEFSAADENGNPTQDNPHDGSDVVISLTVGDDVDTNSEFGDSVYIQVTESNGLAGGTLFDADDNELTLVTFGEDNDQGLPAGDYYVATLPEGETSVDIRYQPSDENRYRDGKLEIEAWVQSKEQGADNWETKSSTGTVEIEAINNGFDVNVGKVDDDTGNWTVSGKENQSKSGDDGAIKLDITGEGLIDIDGSEKVIAAKLEGIPNGFLVFIDGKLAANAGVDEHGNNTWLIPVDGNTLPDNISILPPQFWSGTLEDIELSVLSGEQGQETWSDNPAKFDFVVEPVASGIESLAPTTSFADANGVINLNLNLALKDRIDASIVNGKDAEGKDIVIAKDTSQETVGLSFSGLGENAMFVLNGNSPDSIVFDNDGGYKVIYHDGVEFDVSYDEDGNYIVTGLSPEDANNLGVIQTADQIDSSGKVTVDAWSIDGDDKSESIGAVDFDVKTPSHAPNAGTDGNDIIVGGSGDQLLDGGAGNDIIYGGAGNDTIIGGAGDDILIGGAGNDTFVWKDGDAGSAGTPAEDRIMDFGLGDDDPNGKDTIDLSDLLQGEGYTPGGDDTEFDVGNLLDFLYFTEEEGNTIINISSKGKFDSSSNADNSDKVDQKIVLDGVSLSDFAGDTDAQSEMIKNLIDQGKINVDQGL